MAEAMGKGSWVGETGSWGFLPSRCWHHSRGKFYLSQLFDLETQELGAKSHCIPAVPGKKID